MTHPFTPVPASARCAQMMRGGVLLTGALALTCAPVLGVAAPAAAISERAGLGFAVDKTHPQGGAASGTVEGPDRGDLDGEPVEGAAPIGDTVDETPAPREERTPGFGNGNPGRAPSTSAPVNEQRGVGRDDRQILVPGNGVADHGAENLPPAGRVPVAQEQTAPAAKPPQHEPAPVTAPAPREESTHGIPADPSPSPDRVPHEYRHQHHQIADPQPVRGVDDHHRHASENRPELRAVPIEVLIPQTEPQEPVAPAPHEGQTSSLPTPTLEAAPELVEPAAPQEHVATPTPQRPLDSLERWIDSLTDSGLDHEDVATVAPTSPAERHEAVTEGDTVPTLPLPATIGLFMGIAAVGVVLGGPSAMNSTLLRGKRRGL